jgi:hypothetical protein
MIEEERTRGNVHNFVVSYEYEGARSARNIQAVFSKHFMMPSWIVPSTHEHCDNLVNLNVLITQLAGSIRK